MRGRRASWEKGLATGVRPGALRETPTRGRGGERRASGERGVRDR
ncbi:hypothetical protein STTU_2078 [Streptomyces sp. Tu6071]|nr:hypothetical protein STTU_2078 [Streptomyces sp. Tu6071]